MSFDRVFSGAPWEKEVGYCRVVRAGDHVYVTGTAPINKDGSTHAPEDAYAQAFRCLELIEENLKKMNISLSSIVRTGLFVTDISRWKEYGKAHREFFAEHPPATTMVGVQQLICEKMLIEIEADAYLGSDSKS